MKKLLFLILFFTSPVYATDYYVDKDGNNGNSCPTATSATDTNAKLTITAGLSCLVAGDTLFIGAGTYTEGIEYNAIPSGISDVARTIVQAETGATVIVNGENSFGGVLASYYRSYITISGLILDGVNTSAGYVVLLGGDPGGGFSSYITIENGIVRNNAPGGTSACITQNGVGGDTSNLIFRNLEVYNCTGASPNGAHGIYLQAHDSLIENCNVHNNDGHGIHLYAGSGMGVNNNVVRGNEAHANGSFGILLGSGTGNAAYNNLVYGNGIIVAGSGGIRAYSASYSSEINYNTVYGNTGYGIWNQDGVDTVIKNNISYANTSTAILNNGTADISNNFTTDPLFVIDGVDFHLQSTSTAIGTGVTIAYVTIDKDGITRDAINPTPGAFETPSGVDPGSEIFEDFESYTATTSIDGLNEGTGFTQEWQILNGTATVETASCLTGKAFSTSATVFTNIRRFFTVKTGIATIQLRVCSSINNPNSTYGVNLLDQSGNPQIIAAFDNADMVVGGATTTTLVSSYSANTPYRIRFNIDTINHPGEVRLAVDDMEYGSWLSTVSVFTGIGGLSISNYATNAHTFELDDINDDEGPPELPPAPVSLIGTRTRIRMR